MSDVITESTSNGKRGKAPHVTLVASPLEGELRKQTTIPGTEVTSGDPAIDAAALKARLLSVASSKAQSEAHAAREHLRMLMGEAEPPCLRVVGVDDENKRFEFVEEPGKSKLKMREIEGGA